MISCVLGQFAWNDLVERVSRGVMVVEIRPAILDRAEVGDAAFSQGVDVRSHFVAELQEPRPGGLQDLRHRFEKRFQLRLSRHVNAERMTGAEIGFDGSEMVSNLSRCAPQRKSFRP